MSAPTQTRRRDRIDAYEYRNRAAACVRAAKAAHAPDLKRMFNRLERQWRDLAEYADRSARGTPVEDAQAPSASPDAAARRTGRT